MRENPNLTFAEVARLMAERYKSIDPQETQRLDELVKRDKERSTNFHFCPKSFMISAGLLDF